MRRLLYRSFGLLFAGVGLYAGTISSASAITDSGQMCDDVGSSSAVCFLTEELASAGASANSSFGAVSGSLFGQLFGQITQPVAYAGASFQAGFSDYVVITGGTGAGSLMALFGVRLRGGPVHPSYSVIVGDVEQSGDELSTTMIPVSSSFTFGVPTRIGGMVMGWMSSLMLLSAEDRSFNSDADLNLVEIRVFDDSGNLVPGALVEPQGADVNFFGPVPQPVPEPSTWILSVCLIVFGRWFCSPVK